MPGLYDPQQDPRGAGELGGPSKYISMTESVNSIMQGHNTLVQVLFCIYAAAQAFTPLQTQACVRLRVSV